MLLGDEDVGHGALVGDFLQGVLDGVAVVWGVISMVQARASIKEDSAWLSRKGTHQGIQANHHVDNHNRKRKLPRKLTTTAQAQNEIKTKNRNGKLTDLIQLQRRKLRTQLVQQLL